MPHGAISSFFISKPLSCFRTTHMTVLLCTSFKGTVLLKAEGTPRDVGMRGRFSSSPHTLLLFFLIREVLFIIIFYCKCQRLLSGYLQQILQYLFQFAFSVRQDYQNQAFQQLMIQLLNPPRNGSLKEYICLWICLFNKTVKYSNTVSITGKI